MARMQGFGKKREEEEEQKRAQQQKAADASQDSAVVQGRNYAKETAGALGQTGYKVVSETKVNPFEQTAKKANEQLLADYDAEMAGRDGMAMGMTPKRDLGTRDVEVDFSTIRDNKQAAYFAGTLANEDVAEEFLKDWADYSQQDIDDVLYSAEDLLGDRLFAAPHSTKGKNQATVNTAMGTLASGLMMDADGNDIDLTGASLPMVIQGIRADPDTTSRKEKTKALYTLTQTPGSRFYGMTFDEDEANTFLYSADWDDKDYTDAVKEYQSAFYAGSGHDEDNLKKYLELVASINEGDELTGDAYSKRQSRSMRAALDKAWASATGLPAPTDEDIAAWNELNQTAQAEGKKASPLVTWLFGDKERKAEKESARESTQPEQASTIDQIASTDGGRWINQLQEKREDAGAQMQAQFGGAKNGGNVDLAKRPQVSYENMAAAGWGDYTEPGGVSTVLTTGYGTPEDGFVAQMTPIREDGSVLTPEELDAYYDSVREAVRQGKNIAEADPEHLVLASKHGTPEELAKEKDWLESYGEKLHQAQEAYYAETPAQAQEQTGEGKRWFSELYESRQEEQSAPVAQRESVETPEEAMSLLLKGEALTEDESVMLAPYTESNAGKLLLGISANGDTPKTSEAIQSEVGATIDGALTVLKSGILDEQTTGMGYLALIQLMQEVDGKIESGEYVPPELKNRYSYYIQQNESAKSVINSIDEARDLAIQQQKNMVQAQKQAEQEAYNASVRRAVEGTATEEDLQAITDANTYGSNAKRTDSTYKSLQLQLGTVYYSEAGGYWDNPSAAASECVEGKVRDQYRRQLIYKANELLNEYADVANGLGMTTQEYLNKCGITDLDQLVDMAHTRMLRQGSEFLNSPAAQAGIQQDNSPTIGVFPAAGAGAAYGVVSTADSFASAPYNLVSLAAYDANVNDIRNSYNGQYGVNGRAIYREQLIQYANSGNLSEEQSTALLNDITRAKDIYDVGYKIDQGFISNGYRSFLTMMDNTKKGLTDFAALGNDFEQGTFNAFANITESAAGMGIAGAVGAMGAPAIVASGVAYGMTTWNDTFEEARADGMSMQVAAAYALPPAIISTVVNSPGAKAEGNMLGGRNLLEYQLAKQDALKTATFWGKMKLYLADISKNALSEGKEEVEEGIPTSLYQSIFYPAFQKIDAGQTPEWSDILGGMTTIDPFELLKEGANDFIGGAFGSIVFSVVGDAKLAIQRRLPNYNPPSLQLCEQMLDGKADVTEENIAKVTESLAEELEKPEVAQAVNEAAKQAQDAQNTVAAAAAGVGAQHFEEGNEQVRMQQTAQQKADAAQQAADAAKSEFEEYSTAVMAGNLEKIKDMQQARVRMGENQKTANEYADTAEKHKAAAQEAYQKGMDEARTRGAQISREQNAQTVEQWRAEMEAMSQIADIDTEMDTIRQSYAEAEEMGLDEDTRQAIEDRLNELRRERVEIGLPGREEAAQTRETFEQQYVQAKELGMDEDTLSAIQKQIELAQAKERIYTQSAYDWALEEELYPGETGERQNVQAAQTTGRYANPDAEVQLTGTQEQQTGERIAPEENYGTADGRPEKTVTVASATFEEAYAPELKTLDAIIKAGKQAEALTQALRNGEPVSAKQIEQAQNVLSESLSQLDDDALDVFASEVSDALTKSGELEIETDEAKARDEANAQASYEKYLTDTAKKELAKETYTALDDVAKTLRNRKVFINESQAADILYMTEKKTIPQVNIAYGTKFTTNRAERAIPLDGKFYVELAKESRGIMDEASLNPHEDIMRALMRRKEAYRAIRQKVEEPKDRAQIRRAAKAVMEGDVGKSAEGEQKRTYRGVEVEQAEGKSKKNSNIVKTVKKLAQDIGVGSTLGARNMKEAQGGHGFYRDAMRYMATDAVSAGRVDINMHEIGHAISERTGITGTPEMVAALKAENASWGKSYTEAEMAGEAMAEFTWRYMVSDEAAKDFAGEGFFAQFEQAVADAGMEKPIAKAKTDIRNYLNASFSERVRAMVVDRSDIKSNEKLDEAFLFALVDSTAPAEKANKIIRDATGEKVVAFEDNLRESALLRNTADKRAYAQLTESLTDVRGTRIGDSLKERIKESGLKGKDLQEWLNWMLVKHSLDRDKQGKPVLDNNTYPRAERLAYIQQTERTHPEFAKAQKAFQSFRHDFMQAWMVDTGYLKAWQLEQFEAMYPSYVPTNRVKDNAPVGSSRSGGGKTYTIRSAKGSTEQIVSPFDSFCEMTQRIVRMNMENQTNLLFDRLYKEYEGFGVLGRPIEQTQSTFDDKQTHKLQDKIQSKLEKAGADMVDIGDILIDIDEDRAKFVGTANENNVITAQHPDGSKTYYTITDPLFYKMMTNATDNGKSIFNVIGKVTHAMSALTTGSNPVFTVRNFLRDFQSSVNYGTWATSYADGLYKWVKAVLEILTDKDAYKDYVALGGGGWTRVSTGDAKSSKQLRGAVFDNGRWSDNYSTQTLGGKGKWAGKKLWRFATLAYPNEVIEQASRFAEYRYGKHDLTTDVGRAEAFRAAQDVTVDFSRRGASGIARNISDFVPFFNASLQGTYRTARQGTKQESGQAAKRFVKTLLNTGALVALANAALLGMDDEDKEAFMYMSDDLKSKHIFLPNFAPNRFGDAPLIRIPVEQDPVAYAVNSLMTNVMWKGEGDEWAIDFTASMATIADGLYPISGTIADPILSMQTNKNWYGSRIVPSYMENWDPSTQYTEDTAVLFVLGGRALSMSPMMLQYVAQQYTGYLGQVVIPAMSDMDASNPATALFSSTVAYARKQLTSNPLVSNDVVSRVNDNTKFLNTVVKAGENGKEFNMLRGDLTPRQAQKAYDVAYDLTHSGGALYEAKQAISEGYEQIDAINGRDDLTDEQKYELTNSIRMKMCRLALKANEVYAKYEELYVTGESLGSHIIKQAYGGTTIKKQK